MKGIIQELINFAREFDFFVIRCEGMRMIFYRTLTPSTKVRILVSQPEEFERVACVTCFFYLEDLKSEILLSF